MRINVYDYGDENDPCREGPRLVGHFDWDKAEKFKEDTHWNGNNLVSVHVGEYEHQTLIRTTQGRWVIDETSQWQGAKDKCWYVDDETARNWLLRNNDDEIIERFWGPIEEEQGPGRPTIGPSIGIKFYPETRAKLDAEAGEQRISVAELVRGIVEAHYAVVSA